MIEYWYVIILVVSRHATRMWYRDRTVSYSIIDNF